jgi:hypothetical protein
VEVTRQYCGALEKVANRQAGVFLARVGPRGRDPGGQAPVPAEEMYLEPHPLCGGGRASGPAAVLDEDRPGPGDARKPGQWDSSAPVGPPGTQAYSSQPKARRQERLTVAKRSRAMDGRKTHQPGKTGPAETVN